MDDDDLLSLAEAATRAGLSPVTLRTQYYRGRLPGVLKGHTILVRWHDVQAYLESRARVGRYRGDAGTHGEGPR